MSTIDLGKIKLVWRGAYNNATAYTPDDVVSSGGTSYICILASTGNAVTNTTYWNVLAEGGDVASTLTTQGDILYRDGSGLAKLAAGTSGQLLQTGGSGANPSWTDAPAGITQFDQWRMTANNQSSQDPVGASGNIERPDDAVFAKIGSGMTNSSGIFSFPETGLYWLMFNIDGDSSSGGVSTVIEASTDSGSSYDAIAWGHNGDGQGWYVAGMTSALFNVTNISTARCKFRLAGSGTFNIYGHTDRNATFFTFIRVGDSQ